MRKLFFISGLLVFVAYGKLRAQSANKIVIDSLKFVLLTAKEDTVKIMLLTKISGNFSTSDFDSSFYYLNEAQKLAEQKKQIIMNNKLIPDIQNTIILPITIKKQ